MFNKMWQWLNKLIVSIFGGKNRIASSHGYLSKNGQVQKELAPPLTDTDYEFLWLQLLEGVAHGWHSQKLVNFFTDLGDRGKEELWISWLNRFEEKLLATSSPNQQLGSRMLQFGQKTQTHYQLKNIGAKSYNIGRKLVNRKLGSVIWEYDGADVLEKTVAIEEKVTPLEEITSSQQKVNLPQQTVLNEDKVIPLEKSVTSEEKIITPQKQIPLSEVIPTPQISYDTSTETKVNIPPITTPQKPDTIIQSSSDVINQNVTEVEILPQKIPTPDIEKPLQQDSLPDPWQEKSSDLEKTTQTETKPKIEENLTFNKLIEKLKKEDNFRQEVASQLGLNTDNIQDVILALQEKMNITPSNQSPPSNIPSTPLSQPVDEPKEYEKLFYQGLEEADKGKMNEAIACWDQALELNSNISAIWHNRGSALGHLGRLEDAIASFDQAIKINPKDYQAWNDRGNAFYNLRKWDQALASWDEVIKIKSNFTQAWYNRGCVLEHLNKLDEAIQSYNQALQLQPDFEMAINRLNNVNKKINS